MRFIFSTGSLYTYGTERCFDLAARAGFAGIELMVDERWDTRQPAYVLRLVDRYRLPVVAVHSPFAQRLPGWPDDEVGRILLSVQLAEALGAEVVVHHLPARMGTAWLQAGGRRYRVPVLGWDRDGPYRSWLREGYAAEQEHTPVTLCIENMPAQRLFGRPWNGHTWNSPAEIARFPALTLDTTHLATWGQEPSEVYAGFPLGKVRHIHLSNYDGREHRRPEDGTLQLERLVAQLATDGYAGAVTLELHPDALEAGADDARIEALLSTSLGHCRAWAGA
ncbi:MAG TPA: sugar phosphate isomerase/epimerase [Chloroflexota bacterium]|nr:sugar phosphate isomerase/epimerase [Chloroflexota bacterium]